MTGVDLLVLSAAGAAAVLLVAAGAGHVRHRDAFVAVLAAQRLVPVPARRVVAASIGPVELVLGLGLLGGLVVGGPVGRAVAIAAGALYLCFGGYVAVVWRTRPRVPCGCFAGSGPASGWTVLRALLLGLGCLGASASGATVAPGTGVLVAAGAAVLTAVFWLLPELAGIG